MNLCPVPFFLPLVASFPLSGQAREGKSSHRRRKFRRNPPLFCRGYRKRRHIKSDEEGQEERKRPFSDDDIPKLEKLARSGKGRDEGKEDARMKSSRWLGFLRPSSRRGRGGSLGSGGKSGNEVPTRCRPSRLTPPIGSVRRRTRPSERPRERERKYQLLLPVAGRRNEGRYFYDSLASRSAGLHSDAIGPRGYDARGEIRARPPDETLPESKLALAPAANNMRNSAKWPRKRNGRGKGLLASRRNPLLAEGKRQKFLSGLSLTLAVAAAGLPLSLSFAWRSR